MIFLANYGFFGIDLSLMSLIFSYFFCAAGGALNAGHCAAGKRRSAQMDAGMRGIEALTRRTTSGGCQRSERISWRRWRHAAGRRYDDDIERPTALAATVDVIEAAPAAKRSSVGSAIRRDRSRILLPAQLGGTPRAWIMLFPVTDYLGVPSLCRPTFYRGCFPCV
jgi:hypothetical protein